MTCSTIARLFSSEGWEQFPGDEQEALHRPHLLEAGEGWDVSETSTPLGGGCQGFFRQFQTLLELEDGLVGFGGSPGGDDFRCQNTVESHHLTAVGLLKSILCKRLEFGLGHCPGVLGSID